MKIKTKIVIIMVRKIKMTSDLIITSSIGSPCCAKNTIERQKISKPIRSTILFISSLYYLLIINSNIVPKKKWGFGVRIADYWQKMEYLGKQIGAVMVNISHVHEFIKILDHFMEIRGNHAFFVMLNE
jgi:hypothetical protein